ncbi:hypothetical protein [Gilvibacter sp.]
MNHKRVEMRASFKKEARFFFEVNRSVSFCGSQQRREGNNHEVIESH